MDDSRIRTASELLNAFFDAEKLGRAGEYARFFSSWKYIAGEHLASHSRIDDVENGVLIVVTDHPGWIQLLQLRQSAILEGIRSRFPELELRAIAFRLGSLARPGRTEAKVGPGGGTAASPEARSFSTPPGETGANPRGPSATRMPESTLASIQNIASEELRQSLSSLKDAMEKEGD